MSTSIQQSILATPYESPIIVLSVGPKDGNPVEFHVHKRFIDLPYFNAALREDAFIEGQQGKIDFEEEDPAVFRRVVEFLYEGDCFPRKLKSSDESFCLEAPLLIKRVSDDKEMEYKKSCAGEMAMGAYITMPGTNQMFLIITQTLCVAERYGIEDLLELCFDKIRNFPIGTNEFVILAQHVIKHLPETRFKIHQFLADQLYLHVSRLHECKGYESLLETEMSLLGRGLMKLVTGAISSQGRSIDKNFNQYYYLAICIEDVNAKDCSNKYGANSSKLEYGTARVGEILTTSNTSRGKDLFSAKHLRDDSESIFPKYSFKLLKGADFT
ncbi:hypothetical protein F5884DRAFT_780179 [Xylogone sp. PMI_703]|nr:hypothetical protein F5884DRAFT_780179 [Xylogone sp. PMI_703]